MAARSTPKTLPIYVSEDSEVEGKGILSPSGEAVLRHLPISELNSNLAEVCGSFLEVLEGIRQVGRFRLQTAKVNVEVSAEGGIEFIGTAKLGGKGAIELTFTE
jgi:hypothetical protein